MFKKTFLLVILLLVSFNISFASSFEVKNTINDYDSNNKYIYNDNEYSLNFIKKYVEYDSVCKEQVNYISCLNDLMDYTSYLINKYIDIQFKNSLSGKDEDVNLTNYISILNFNTDVIDNLINDNINIGNFTIIIEKKYGKSIEKIISQKKQDLLLKSIDEQKSKYLSKYFDGGKTNFLIMEALERVIMLKK